ncbi:MAG: HNH endonuclease [Saprospiraceae bacterium]|jgi:hypothetical protein|nr:HNH endonuclease [Saprospiraceae bacterium]
MSYEGDMFKKLGMPSKMDVELAILKTLFKNNGTIKEFASGEEIVTEIANLFSLNEEQRHSVLERIYYKENRIAKTPVWHRLLYRAADSLANENLITRPSTTYKLTNKKEWMLTEAGIDKSLNILNIPSATKENLSVKSFEVQKLVNKMKLSKYPNIYDPFKKEKQTKFILKEHSLRERGFRQIVIESYDCKCSLCGLKLPSPNNLLWEVEAAHIVPHRLNGKDEIWNGIAFCKLHHWAFDVGWFSLTNDYKIIVSKNYNDLPENFGKMLEIDFLLNKLRADNPISLPTLKDLNPHIAALEWHRKNVLFK